MDMLRSNPVSQQEYLLQGSVLDTHRETLLHRLNGLCDMVDTGPEKFHDHELVYSLRGGSAAVQPIILRVRQALDHPGDPWHVRYVGQADVGDKSQHTLIRSCVDVGTSDNIRQFLTEMGFQLDFEYVVKGYVFHKGRLKVTVSKLSKVISTGSAAPDKLESMTMSHLVELSVVTPYGQDQIQDDMRNFSEQLKPLVHLEKIDHRRLQQQ